MKKKCNKTEICSHPIPPKTTDEKIIEILRFALENRDAVRLLKIGEIILKRAHYEKDISSLESL